MTTQTHNTTPVRFLIIYNEQSGQALHHHKKMIKHFFEKHDVACVFHNTRPDGSFLNINPSAYERIIVAGGDGTLKEVANWIIKSNSSTPLAIIPRGSGNIVAQSLGIPLNTHKALKIALQGQATPIDAGLINRREYFLLAAGMGFDANIIRNTSKKMKRFFGVLAYGEGVLKSFLNIKVNKVFVKSAEVEGVFKAQSIFISNVKNFFNFVVSPDAKINDGKLNVAIFKPLNARDAIITLLRILMGQHSKEHRYLHFETNAIYVLPLSKRVPKQIDGEFVELPYFDITVVPQAIAIVTPQSLT